MYHRWSRLQRHAKRGLTRSDIRQRRIRLRLQRRGCCGCGCGCTETTTTETQQHQFTAQREYFHDTYRPRIGTATGIPCTASRTGLSVPRAPWQQQRPPQPTPSRTGRSRHRPCRRAAVSDARGSCGRKPCDGRRCPRTEGALVRYTAAAKQKARCTYANAERLRLVRAELPVQRLHCVRCLCLSTAHERHTATASSHYLRRALIEQKRHRERSTRTCQQAHFDL